MRTNLWIPVLVATAVAAGIVAFLAASPSGPSRVTPTEVGFRKLQQDQLERIAAEAAAFHREQALGRRTVAQSRQVATAWLAAVAGSNALPGKLAKEMPRGVRLGGATPADARDVSSFVRWADDLPRSTWSSQVRGAMLAGDRRTGTVTIPASVAVTTFQATKRTRVDKLDVTLRMRPYGAAANRGPLGWTIIGIKAGPAPGTQQAMGLRVFVDPIIIVRDAIQVVAARGDRAEAVRIADHADTALPYLRARFAGIGSSSLATIWLVPRAGVAGRILGDDGPKTPSGALPLAWTTDAGDVVLDLEALEASTPVQRLGTTRHELTHLATMALIDKAPSMLIEGLALYEETQYVTEGTTLKADLRPLQKAFTDGTLGYQGLLANKAREFSPTVPRADVTLGSLAGYATIAYLEEEFDHQRVLSLVAQVRGGTRIDEAVQNVLRVDTVLLQFRVKLWVDSQVGPPATDNDSVAGNGNGQGAQP